MYVCTFACAYVCSYSTSILKKLSISKKGIGIERYTQYTTVTLIYEKVPKQDEQVKLLRIIMRLQDKIELNGYYICNKN